MNACRHIVLMCLLSLLGACASRSSQAIGQLDDKSPDFSTGACQNARHNAWVHDELKTHKLWAAPALVLLTGPVAVAPLFFANIGINTADHLKAADITTQCGGTAPTQDAVMGGIALDTALGIAIGTAVPGASLSATGR
jgi:hypothetical protein